MVIIYTFFPNINRYDAFDREGEEGARDRAR